MIITRTVDPRTVLRGKNMHKSRAKKKEKNDLQFGLDGQLMRLNFLLFIYGKKE